MSPSQRDSIGNRGGPLSFGGYVICSLALVSSLAVWWAPRDARNGLEFWTFARPHYALYQPLSEVWNRTHTPPLNILPLSLRALEQRMLAGFVTATPSADLIEVERSIVGGAFAGPIEDVGFMDLTDRLRTDGLAEEFNAPSFSPWTSRGRIFGIPHDVHPVLLAYRADLVEAAGIDVSQIETWRDFAEILKPLMRDEDRDGRPDRYLLNLWPQQIDAIEALVLQAGGSFFDPQGKVAMDTPINARVAATIVTWCCGPARIAIDAEEFTPSGNRLKIEGRVIASLMPDWLAGVWKQDMPQLDGRLKLMPLPAWEPGGRRTSVWGGSMLGIAKSSADPNAAWEAAKYLYLSEDVARGLYETNGIISPVKRFWTSSYYDRADHFFQGQAPGRLFIREAPEVPLRTSSPFNRFAAERMRDAVIALRDYAVREKQFRLSELLDEAHHQLQRVETTVQRRVQRNLFLAEDR